MNPVTTRKVFVIGCNKTGTTSLGAALELLGFKLGDQEEAESLLEDWARRDFGRVLKYCESADAFQDVPFSLADTYAAVDRAFPGSRFILSVRSTSDEWYESLVRFFTKIIGKGRLPNADDLKEFIYRKRGFLWQGQMLIYGADEKTLFDRALYIRHYESHNRRILQYFEHRPGDLLVLNLNNPSAMALLCDFLEIEPGRRTFAMPHLNTSRAT